MEEFPEITFDTHPRGRMALSKIAGRMLWPDNAKERDELDRTAAAEITYQMICDGLAPPDRTPGEWEKIMRDGLPVRVMRERMVHRYQQAQMVGLAVMNAIVDARDTDTPPSLKKIRGEICEAFAEDSGGQVRMDTEMSKKVWQRHKDTRHFWAAHVVLLHRGLGQSGTNDPDRDFPYVVTGEPLPCPRSELPAFLLLADAIASYGSTIIPYRADPKNKLMQPEDLIMTPKDVLIECSRHIDPDRYVAIGATLSH